MENNNKLKKILIIIGPVVLLVTVLSISYAYFRKSSTQSNLNTLDILNCLSTTLTDETSSIDLTDEFPITNEEGMEKEPYIFKITNDCDSYISADIALEVLPISTLDAAYVRGSLNPTGDLIDNSNKLTNFILGTSTIEGATSYILKKDVIILANASESFDLRIWIDYDTTSEQGFDKTFEGKIVVAYSPARGHIANYKYVETSGEGISIGNTYEDSAYVKINGKSEQVITTQGNNLCDIERVYLELQTLSPKNAVKTTKDGRNVIKLTNHSPFYNKGVYFFRDIKWKENTRYTFKWEVFQESSTASIGTYFEIYYTDGTQHTSGVLQTRANEWKTVTLITQENKTISYIKHLYNTGSAITYINLDNFSCNEGTTALSPYEPFVPDSPSPNYPSPIHNVGDDGGFDLVSSGKNLFDKENADLTKYVSADTGVIGSSISGNTVSPYIKVLSNTSYYLSGLGLVFAPQSTAGIAWYDGNKTFISGYRYGNTAGGYGNAQYTSPSNAKYAILTVWEGSLDTAQFEQNTSITSYEPYRTNIINFPYTLRSLTDGTKDYIEIDNVNKTAKLYKNIEVKSFNGTENWPLQGGTNPNANGIISFLFSLSTETTPTTETVASFCSHLPKREVGLSAATDEGYFVQRGTAGTTLFVRMNATRVSTLSEFKSYLNTQNANGTPVKVQYQLAEPVVTNLDYNKVKTYYLYTNIHTNAVIKPTLDVKVKVIDQEE